ncbi:MAG: 5-(carboxyamino)imidazole ribonucleotide synthase [Chitinophagales bacterium]|nr:5-(carboxyamino)imidazole ribonucleotide synthase [Hyphomicrobiales bacterium]
MAAVLEPGDTIGILGGGQLGRMLVVAAAKLGLRAHIYAPESDSPAFDVAAQTTSAPYEDIAALRTFAQTVQVVTYEFENIPALSVAVLEELAPVYPPRRALVSSQDRLAERRLLQSLELSHAPFHFVPSADALSEAFAALGGGSAFLKKLRNGYDGKGQMKIANAPDLAEAALWLNSDGAILEAAISFHFELSVIGVRGREGATAFYDSPRNVHREGILRESHVPSAISESQQACANAMVGKIMAELDYVGVMAVEMFAVGEPGAQTFLINEIAPRVHNSGHWTLEACAINQFENHIRAVAGWPLGSSERHSNAVMTNLIGNDVNVWREHLATPGRSLHIYGKGEPRSGRKMGHYTDTFAKIRNGQV